MALKIGDKAPDFTLKNTDGEDVTLSSQLDNNVILLFYPLAFTSVCTKELCYTRDHLKEFEELDAKVFAISVDSFFTLKEFKKAQNFNFTLLSDFNKEVSENYDALYDEFLGYKGVAKRSAFVIGKNGKIKFAEILEDAGELPDFDAVKSALAQ